ncbi:metallophosphoesterase family protein [Dokdonella ginsengisoli]|uniref:Phosphoesterase n=1 Tax=Dokdonella ginsengisoli TaxID=363846 RepID=A0ABV9R0B6_9GAMM
MRVLLVSDTHGVLDARIEALAREAALVVHAGDVGSAQVLERLRRACPRVIAVRGNNDVASKWACADLQELQTLGESVEIDLPGGVLAATHGDRFAVARRHALLRAAFPGARAVVYGHSHRLGVDDGERPWVLNPGAAGRARTFGGPSGLLLHAAAKSWTVEAVRFPR